MKTNAPLPLLTCLVFALAAVSCQTTAVPKTAGLKTELNRSHWVKVSAHPPTYYPRTVPADAPTDHWNGEWVYTKDETGSRYFIPFRNLDGMDRKSLVQEALSARSEEKLQQIAREDREIQTRNVRNLTIFGPPSCTGLLAAGMAGVLAGVGPDTTLAHVDVPQLQKEWKTSKQPR